MELNQASHIYVSGVPPTEEVVHYSAPRSRSWGDTYSHGPHSELNSGLRQLESPALSPSVAFLTELCHLTEFLGPLRFCHLMEFLGPLCFSPLARCVTRCVSRTDFKTTPLLYSSTLLHSTLLLYFSTLLLYSHIARRVTWTNH